jgi:protein Mpv17
MSTTAEVAAPKLKSFFPRTWRRYLDLTDAYPLRTQCATAMLFAGLGNFISQTAVEKRSLRTLDWPSIAKFTMIAACVTFPIIRSWLWTLERLVPGTGRFVPLKKVLIDQLVFAPFFLATFILLMGCVEGRGWEDAKERLSHVSVNWNELIRINKNAEKFSGLFRSL